MDASRCAKNFRCDECALFVESIRKKNHRIQALEEENYILSSKNKSLKDEYSTHQAKD